MWRTDLLKTKTPPKIEWRFCFKRGGYYLLEPAFNPGCGAGGLLSPFSPSLE